MAKQDTTSHSRSRKRGEESHLSSLRARLNSWKSSFVNTFLPEELRSARTFAKYCPLIAAVSAPLSTLMDIPALTQHWYTLNGVSQKDPTACLVLSAIGLTLNVIANGLLVFRFSSKKAHFWQSGTRLSLIFWIGKTTVAVVNLIIFGMTTRNGPGYAFDEAFWCAVVSVILSGVISLALSFHYALAFGHSEFDKEDIRLEGRKFMLSVTFFMFLLGLQAFVFDRIEGWGYLNSIYFSVQCALTIGYGDYVPTTAAGKVLVFPFSVFTISQLANEVSMIIDFISNRAQEKRDKWRQKYALAMHREASKRFPRATLIQEMALIHQINLHQETMVQLYDLLWSAFSLIAFWLIGACVFHFIEFWGYGNAVYAVMILSLTIGFGDYVPTHPAGRVFWIIYSLMAVPIVTSFAVQTVTGILYTYSEHRFARERFALERDRNPEVFAPHSHFILRHHESWDETRKQYVGEEVAVMHGAAEDEHDRSQRDDETASQGEGDEHEEQTAENNVLQDMMDGSETGNEAVRDLAGPDPGAGTREQSGRDSPNSAPSWHGSVGLDSIGQESIRQGSAVNSTDELNEKDLRNALEAEASGDDRDDTRVASDRAVQKLESDLIKQLINRVTMLEAQARQMLIDSMSRDLPRTLLIADRNVQLRDALAIHGDVVDIEAIWKRELQKTQEEGWRRERPEDAEDSTKEERENNDEDDMLARVRRYRDTFAEILVVSSILLKLEGEESKRFERWETDDESQPRPEIAQHHRLFGHRTLSIGHTKTQSTNHECESECDQCEKCVAARRRRQERLGRQRGSSASGGGISDHLSRHLRQHSGSRSGNSFDQTQNDENPRDMDDAERGQLYNIVSRAMFKKTSESMKRDMAALSPRESTQAP